MKLSRRDALALAVGAAASPLLPHVEAGAATIPTLPAFAVGTPGEFNWKVIFARTVDRAKEIWYDENGWYEPDERELDLDANSVPHLDGLATEEGEHPPSVSDCIEMGWDHNCVRCYRDVSCDGDNYRDIGGEAVCQECLTPQEVDADDHEDFLNNLINEQYDLTDPAIFALLRPADFVDDSILEMLAEESALHPECLLLLPFAKSEHDLKAAHDGLGSVQERK